MRRPAAVALFAFAFLVLAPEPVEANCSITTTGVAFGSYNVFAAAPVDSTGSVRYQCSGGSVIFTISLSRGASSTFQPRRMASGTDTLSYNLYLDAARISIWGDGTGGTAWFTATSVTGKPATATIFGRIPAGQDVAVGSYSDTIVVTIQF